tara:strand:+ start:17698 stop:19131 length:1434 start_codon:yes stop_codon:yes gene_type:complete
MKKVEVYFLINLGAILSLFAIEGELSIYMRRQNDILLTAADDKLKTLVEIDNVKSNFENEGFYQLTFDVNGEYEKGSIEFEPSFTTPILDVGEGGDIAINDSMIWELDSVSYEALEGPKYALNVKLSSVGEEYINKPYDVNLGIKFIPDISEQTVDGWGESFGDYKVADKLYNIINEKVSREGKFAIEKQFDSPVTLIYMDGLQSEFFVLFDKEKYTVLRGLNWKIPFSVGGVNSDKDFSLSVEGGKDLVKELVKGLPRTFLKGVGKNDGTIEVVGLRKKDKKSSLASTEVVVVDPVYSSPAEESEIYTGEQYVFDSRIKDVDRDRISVKVSGTAMGANVYNSYRAKFTPKKQGKLKLETFVDGAAVRNLVHNVTVKKVPPPKLTFKRLGKRSNNMMLTVTTYGNKNGKNKVVPLSGVYGRLEEEQKEKRVGNRRVAKYSFEMDEPQFGSTTTIKIKVIDKYRKQTVSDNEYEYYDN